MPLAGEVRSIAQHSLELRHTADSSPLYHICIDCTRLDCNAGLLFSSLLAVARDELHNLQHESLNLLTDVAAHTTDFDRLVEDIPFIEEVENIPPPISAVLPARSPSPE